MTRPFRFLFFSLIAFAATFISPVAAQQTLFQGFEHTSADNWPFLAIPTAYNDVPNEDQWTDTTVVPAIAPATGDRFWYMRDLENTGGGGAFFHTLDFDPVDVSAFSANTLTFKYYTEAYEAADSLGYIVEYDNGTTWDFSKYTDLNRNTLAWTTVTVNVPAGSPFVRLRLMAKQNGGSDYAGWDDVQLFSSASDVVPPQVLNASVIDPGTLQIVFNEPMGPSAADISHYTGINGLSAAVLSPSGDTVTLSFGTPIEIGTPQTLAIDGVQDVAGNPIAAPYVFAFTISFPQISFVNARVRIDENTGTIAVPVKVDNLNVPLAQAKVRVVEFSTAVENEDFNLLDSVVTFVAGATDPFQVEVEILDNSDLRDSRYLILQLYDFSEAQAGTTRESVVLISDDDTPAPQPQAASPVKIRHLTSFDVDPTANATAEISAFDPVSKRLFTTNISQNKLEIVDLKNPYALSKIASIDISAYGGGINSVAYANGSVAVAIDATPATDPGKIVFFDVNGGYLNAVTAGALPDHVNFTADGTKLLVANEGEPATDYSVDPEGSVTIVDMTPGAAALTQADVTTLGFTQFNADSAALVASGVRVFGPGATVAQDFEPEYVTVSDDGLTAWVTLQENNALAVIDLQTNTITGIRPLGTKDYAAQNVGLDASDQAPGIFFNNWNVKGLYQPDAIAYWNAGGTGYLLTANEGDVREWDAFAEIVRLNDNGYVLDSAAFPDAAYLKRPELLGRLNVTTAGGDTDGDGDYDEIHTFGGRSISIWNAATGALVWDSGDDLERITAADPVFGPIFNASNSNNTRKNRSDDKGPEPEGVALGTIDGRAYAFAALERIGGVMMYDVTDPAAPVFVQWINTRATGTAAGGDLGPEGILFIGKAQSPNHRDLLVVSNEISGTLSVFEINIDRTQTGEYSLTKYAFDNLPAIGFYGDTIREGGISGLMYRDGSFRFVGDRGPNADAANDPQAMGATALVFPFPDYAPKTWQVRPENGELVVEDFDFIKRPDGTGASGLPLPLGQGNTGEVAWADTNATVVPNDPWGLDSEGLTQDNEGNFWVCDEYGTSIWQLDSNFRVIRRFTPFPVENEDAPLDSLLGKRRANRGLEGVAYTPNGKIYAILQSPADNPNTTAGNNSRIHRLVELDPASGNMRTFVYVHEPVLGEIRSRDWKLGDLTAINNNEFLVLEHAERNGWNAKNIYKFSLTGATPVSGNDFGGQTLEQLLDPAGLSAQGIVPVQKTFFADLLELGWERQHDKPEGLTIVNDSTFAVINDNDFGIASPNADGQIVLTGKTTRLYVYGLPAGQTLGYVSPYCTVSLGDDLAACGNGGEFTLTPQGDFTTYEWSDGSSGNTLTVNAAGQYAVIAENAVGCRSRDTVEVNFYALPVVGLGADTALCAGQNLTLDAGNPGSSYLWSSGANTQLLIVTQTAEYSVVVTDANGCSAADTLTATFNPLPQVNLGPNLGLCSGASLTLNAGNAGSEFAWSTNETTQTVTVTAAGTYSVTVTNAAGCTAADALVVNNAITPNVDLGADQNLCAGQTLNLSSGYPGATTLWNTGATTPGITVGQTGTYAVQVTLVTGCSDADTIQITVNPLPVVSLLSDTTICEGDTLLLDAGNSGAAFLWNTGETTQTIAAATSDLYAVTVTNPFGCSAEADVAVSVQICIDTKEANRLAEARVFPNPTSGLLHVQLSELPAKTALRVLNPMGQVVLSQTQMNDLQTDLDLSALPRGLYLLQLQSGAQAATFRVVVQ